MDKKVLLKEIEMLIRSIKLHYDNIENEHRIPTIELELITSKIRKLHEKSIIYNYIHFQEEERLLNLGRSVPFPQQEPQSMEASGIKADQHVASFKSNVTAETSVTGVLTPPAMESEAGQSRMHQLEKQIGINDRFRFVKNLFNSKPDELDSAVKMLNFASGKNEAKEMLHSLKVRYNWNDQDETVQDFMELVLKKIN